MGSEKQPLDDSEIWYPVLAYRSTPVRALCLSTQLPRLQQELVVELLESTTGDELRMPLGRRTTRPMWPAENRFDVTSEVKYGTGTTAPTGLSDRWGSPEATDIGDHAIYSQSTIVWWGTSRELIIQSWRIWKDRRLWMIVFLARGCDA